MRAGRSAGPEQVSSDLMLVDCHAHLEELEDPEAAIERAGESGVCSILAVGSDLESNHRALALSGRHGEVTTENAVQFFGLSMPPSRVQGA
jgi:Tat protein secretion system quality control protein TatD with DNase activity